MFANGKRQKSIYGCNCFVQVGQKIVILHKKNNIDGTTLVCLNLADLKAHDILKSSGEFILQTIKNTLEIKEDIEKLDNDDEVNKNTINNIKLFQYAFESSENFIMICSDDQADKNPSKSSMQYQLFRKQAYWAMMHKEITNYKKQDCCRTCEKTSIEFRVNKYFGLKLDHFCNSEKPPEIERPKVISVITKLNGFEIEWEPIKNIKWANMYVLMDTIYRVEISKSCIPKVWRSIGQVKGTKILLSFTLIKLGYTYNVRLRAQNSYCIGRFSPEIKIVAPAFILLGKNSISNNSDSLKIRNTNDQSIILANASLNKGIYQWDIYFETKGAKSISFGVARSEVMGQNGIVGSIAGSWGFDINGDGFRRYADGICKDNARYGPGISSEVLIRIVYCARKGGLSFMTIKPRQKPNKSHLNITGISGPVYPAFSLDNDTDSLSLSNFFCHSRQMHPKKV